VKLFFQNDSLAEKKNNFKQLMKMSVKLCQIDLKRVSFLITKTRAQMIKVLSLL